MKWNVRCGCEADVADFEEECESESECLGGTQPIARLCFVVPLGEVALPASTRGCKAPATYILWAVETVGAPV